MVKRAAEKLKYDEMLLAVTGHDLIAKEFKMHPSCYKNYTRICSRYVAIASHSVADETLDDSEGKLTLSRYAILSKSTSSMATSQCRLRY